MAGREEFAKLVGRAVFDPDFALALKESPEVVARSIGVVLDQNQVQALSDLDTAEITKVSGAIRNRLGPAAFVDQQQQQQARMD
jgi:hypothetical protein